MRPPTRRTIATAASLAGTALHTGGISRVTFRPAPSGHGIRFRRLDLDGAGIPALVESVTSTHRGTALGGDRGVRTVEHVLVAVFAAGLDDVEIGVEGPEPPVGDGSAAPFLDALRAAGFVDHLGTPDRLPLREHVIITEGDARYDLRPSDDPRLVVTIDFDHPWIGRQSGIWTLDPATVATELAAARTFGFAADAPELRARGLARGATADTVIVLTDDGRLGGAPLRWPDEFVRHKAADLVGDLMLAGAVPAAEITAYRPSHAGNVALARALRRSPSTVEHS